MNFANEGTWDRGGRTLVGILLIAAELRYRAPSMIALPAKSLADLITAGTISPVCDDVPGSTSFD